MLKDMTGQTCGQLLVIKRAKNTHDGFARWHCVCQCGNTTVVWGTHLRSGNTLSCGCLRDVARRTSIAEAKIRHGKTRAADNEFRREYRSWAGLLNRCYNPKMPKFKHYGGRGIKVCDRWRVGENGKHPFDCFLEDMGRRPEGKSIDRFPNPDGDYEITNCRWATQSEQIRNRSRRART